MSVFDHTESKCTWNEQENICEYKTVRVTVRVRMLCCKSDMRSYCYNGWIFVNDLYCLGVIADFCVGCLCHRAHQFMCRFPL